MIECVFLDRDGVINKDVHYLDKPERIRLLPNAANAIRLLNKQRIKVIVISNQSGVARGYFTEDTLKDINDELIRRLNARNAHIDRIYFCPHHPDDNCKCRKPEPGMLLKAKKEFNINLKNSVMIGDKESDIEAGQRADCRTILISPKSNKLIRDKKIEPDYIAASLYDAANFIIKNGVKKSSVHV